MNNFFFLKRLQRKLKLKKCKNITYKHFIVVKFILLNN